MREMSNNKQALIEFLTSQKMSGKYDSFVWDEALGVFVVACYNENFNFHFNKWNDSCGIVWTLQKLSGNRFVIYMA